LEGFWSLLRHLLLPHTQQPPEARKDLLPQSQYHVGSSCISPLHKAMKIPGLLPAFMNFSIVLILQIIKAFHLIFVSKVKTEEGYGIY
jgi:hypothetical protein